MAPRAPDGSPHPHSFAFIQGSRRQSRSHSKAGAGELKQLRTGPSHSHVPSAFPEQRGSPQPLLPETLAPAEVSTLCSSSLFCGYNFLWVTTNPLLLPANPAPEAAGRALVTGTGQVWDLPLAGCSTWARSLLKPFVDVRPIMLEGKLRHGAS